MIRACLQGRPGATGLLILLCGVCVSAAACRGSESQGEHNAREAAGPRSGSLRPVPLPDLSRLEPAVRQQIERAHAALDAHTSDPLALSERYGAAGMLFQAHELLEPAAASYANARDLAPEDFRWHAYLGYVYVSMGTIDPAIASLERALERRDRDLPLLVRLGELELGTGRLPKARERFEAALAVDPECAAAIAGLGRIALQEKQFAHAVERLEQALALAPWASSLHYPLAMAYRAQGNVPKAEAHLGKRGEIRVGVADPLMDAVQEAAGAAKLVVRERGVAAARTGEWQKAVDALEEALAIDPRDVTTRMYLAGALWMSGHRAASRAQYLEAAKLEPANARAHMYLGRIAALEGRDRQAVEHLQQATHLDAELLPAWLNLAMARQRLRRFAPSLAAYEEAIRLDPGNAHARLGRAFSLIGLGRHADARRRIEQDLEVLPNEPVFVHALARLLAASPDPKVRDGARALALAEEVAPTLQTAQVVETAAMAAAELGRFGEAVQWQQVAIRAAQEAGRADAVKRLTAMLAQYESGRPCREPWDPADPAFSPPPLPIQFGEIDPAAAR